ncbi:histidine phosphatase family protein [Rummeliibacillus suwonensis]|uniref:histidine phosphatase family protein n=1 Tax=Rummeliibacillus suwonensis TaxID=1306154 RepID=UPI001AAF7607|nr:histidine phosphatase family protein [Rummeliibacillus suwonensis]
MEASLYPDFRERLLAAEPVENFEKAIFQVWENPMFSYPGGESNQEAQKRGVDVILKILSQYEGKKVVIGTHGNIMTLIMQYFDNRFDFSFWQQLTMPDIYKLVLKQNKLNSIQKVWLG